MAVLSGLHNCHPFTHRLVIALTVEAEAMEASRSKVLNRNMEKAVQGRTGEDYVRQILAHLPQNEFVVVNNYPIYQTTKQAQVDHIVISHRRVYVIETKTYSGAISGDENSYWWNQHLIHKTVQFHNPILQNEEHILYLRQILNVPMDFVNIVVFCKAQFSVKTQSALVISPEQLKKIIKKCEKMSSQQPLDVNFLASRLNQFRNKKQKNNGQIATYLPKINA